MMNNLENSAGPVQDLSAQISMTQKPDKPPSEHNQEQDVHHHIPDQLKPSLWLAFIGCLGGFMVQLVIGSKYQWGIINVYITSYYRLTDDSVSLEGNSIVFPVLMFSIGLTMRLGLWLCEKLHTATVLYMNVFLFAALVFTSSYMPNFGGFILFYGVLFGLVAGLTFMIPIVEVNKYFHGKKMVFNGIILMGTGLGSVIFGLFSYTYLNPNKLRPDLGYYTGSPQLEEISEKVPSCLRYLSLLYLILGLIGATLLLPVIIANRKRDQHLAENHHEHPTKPGEIDSFRSVLTSKVAWLKIAILFFGSCGVFLINGNYKTYVKEEIDDDQFLTIIGVVAAVGNGGSRILWNILFSKTGYKTVFLINLAINIAVFSTIRFTVNSPYLYMLMVFLINCCLGGFLVMTPTFLQTVFGQSVGSNVYGCFWTVFALANFLSYFYVSTLASIISFDGIIYIVLGMCCIAVPFVILPSFQGQWGNDLHHMGYCSSCRDGKVGDQEHIHHQHHEHNENQSSSNDVNTLSEVSHTDQDASRHEEPSRETFNNQEIMRRMEAPQEAAKEIKEQQKMGNNVILPPIKVRKSKQNV